MTSEISMFSTDSGSYFTVDTDGESDITTVYKGSRHYDHVDKILVHTVKHDDIVRLLHKYDYDPKKIKDDIQTLYESKSSLEDWELYEYDSKMHTLKQIHLILFGV